MHVRARCVGALKPLISSYVMALAMGPHAKWKTRSKLGAGTRLNGGERCFRASFDRLVHGWRWTRRRKNVIVCSTTPYRLPVQLHALP
jgi:hypothetical protein